MKQTVRGYWIAAILGAVLWAPGCAGSSSDNPEVGPPPPDLPKTPAEYDKSAPAEKV